MLTMKIASWLQKGRPAVSSWSNLLQGSILR